MRPISSAPSSSRRRRRGGEKRLVGFRAIPVFAYQDTQAGDGDALDYTPRELPPLMEVARRLGVKVTYAPAGAGNLGNCQTDGSRITLGSEDPAVFFHELAHAAHKRVTDKALKRGQDPYQETTAELAAVVLMHLYGLGDRTGNCWRYVQQYNEDPLRAIMKATNEVGKVLALLLDGEAGCERPSDPSRAESANARDSAGYQAVEPSFAARKELEMDTRLTKEMMDALARPFPADAIQWKPGATNQDKTRGLALAYVDLRHYIDRLNEVAGPDWSDDYEVQEGGKVVLCRLTIAGVPRSDVGEAAASDDNTATTALAQAFKRACVKFGLGAYLYRLPRQWVEYDPQRKGFTDEALAQLQRAVSGGKGQPPNGDGDSRQAVEEPLAPVLQPASTAQPANGDTATATDFWRAVHERGMDRGAALDIARRDGTWAEKIAALN
jgi:hypothetical protein